MSDFLPEYTFVPIGGGYRPAYRLFVGKPLVMVPGAEPLPTATQAVNAAKEYVREKLNPPIRAEQVEVVQDVLGVDAWHRERAGQAARDQQEAFGSIFKRGREIKVERRKVSL